MNVIIQNMKKNIRYQMLENFAVLLECVHNHHISEKVNQTYFTLPTIYFSLPILKFDPKGTFEDD